MKKLNCASLKTADGKTNLADAISHRMADAPALEEFDDCIEAGGGGNGSGCGNGSGGGRIKSGGIRSGGGGIRSGGGGIRSGGGSIRSGGGGIRSGGGGIRSEGGGIMSEGGGIMSEGGGGSIMSGVRSKEWYNEVKVVVEVGEVITGVDKQHQ
ncbi:hypothetical protein Pcinc_023654 [Petrolisthes cinctipes]|uniref:Uncharacterized protein n=1 Tax=Petrolisthes cinctipes TaxID=88211 RepID=A0AAE1KFH4_PETCI|nr:hypothetical protein Pcinc_023654 [Petrolisthes cinctipes]